MLIACLGIIYHNLGLKCPSRPMCKGPSPRSSQKAVEPLGCGVIVTPDPLPLLPSAFLSPPLSSCPSSAIMRWAALFHHVLWQCCVMLPWLKRPQFDNSDTMIQTKLLPCTLSQVVFSAIKSWLMWYLPCFLLYRYFSYIICIYLILRSFVFSFIYLYW